MHFLKKLEAMILKKIILFGFSLMILTMVSCNKNTEPVTDQKARENDEAFQAHFKAKNITAVNAGGGVYYVITKKVDAGRVPVAGDLITFHFQTSLLNGTKIDSTSRLNNKPNYSPFGTLNNLWSLMAKVMKEGERATFYLPYDYGYGETASATVPAYSPIQMDFSVEKLWNEEQQIENYIADNKYTATTTTTGLRYIITKEVAGGEALKKGQTVKVNYTGRLLYFSGILDASNKPTTTFDSGSFSFVLGSGGTVAGFDEGVGKLKVGEKGIIIFPSSLGYKDVAQGSIPAKSPMAFEVEVVSAQ
jgi:FKBP-type peptidyl-prolyl cis-trans isomerase